MSIFAKYTFSRELKLIKYLYFFFSRKEGKILLFKSIIVGFYYYKVWKFVKVDENLKYKKIVKVNENVKYWLKILIQFKKITCSMQLCYRFYIYIYI